MDDQLSGSADWSTNGREIAPVRPIRELSYGTERTGSVEERANPEATAHVVRMKALLTEEQVSEILQVPVRTLQDWRYRKSGPAYLKMGHAVRYREEAVEAWLDEVSVGTSRAVNGGN